MPQLERSPGPWHLEPLQWDQGASIAICNKQHGVLAIIQPLNDAENEASARRDACDVGNGHLMAAAPDLLEALNYLLEQTIDQDLKSGVGLSEGEEDARQQALAAIAKATGHKLLPPDPEGKNDDRARWAGAAVKAFQDVTGTEDEDSLGDLITDLLHWSDRNDYDFDAALDRARAHYEAETAAVES